LRGVFGANAHINRLPQHREEGQEKNPPD
jgi:hypothetical protein